MRVLMEGNVSMLHDHYLRDRLMVTVSYTNKLIQKGNPAVSLTILLRQCISVLTL